MTLEEKALKEAGERLAAKQKEAKEFIDSHKNDAGEYVMTKEETEQSEKMWAEMDELGRKYDEQRTHLERDRKLNADMAELNRPVNRLPTPGASAVDANGNIVPTGAKSLGQMITESESFKNYNPLDAGKSGGEVDGVDMKTLMTSIDGFPAQAPVPTRIVTIGTRRLTVADLIPQDTVTTKFVTWMEETTNTNNADAVAEGAAKPESAIAYEAKSETMKKIAHYIPVTTEQLQYIPTLESIINNRMVVMLKLIEEAKLLTGNGVGANITGFLQKAGTLTQARGTDNNVDAIYKAFSAVRTGSAFAEPSGVVIHPDNFTAIRLMKTTTGEYIWGAPSEAGEDRVWGKPAVKTPAITLNTALTGDFLLFSHISRFGGIRYEVGYIGNQFIENEKTLLVEEFLTLEILKPAAFCKITGLTA